MIKILPKHFLSIMLLFLVFFGANAQWMQTNGPGGGAAYAFAVNFNTLLVGSSFGIYRSNNNGDSWEKIDMGYSDIVYTLMVNGNTIFAGTENGVYFSSDTGLTWQKAGLELDSIRIRSLLAFDSLVLAGTEGNGIFSIIKDGTVWKARRYGNSYDDVLSLAAYDTVVFAGTAQNGILTNSTIDSGKIRWDRVDTGLPALTTINCLLIKDTTIYAGTNQGVIRSPNKGKSWSAINTGLLTEETSYGGSYVRALRFNGNTLLAGTAAGIFRSENSGTNWMFIDSGMNSYNGATAFAIKNDTILVGTQRGGIYRSIDDGRNWSEVNIGFANTIINSFAIADSILFAGSWDRGVCFSLDHGSNWTTVNPGIRDPIDIGSINLTVRKDTVFASSGKGVFKSTDFGLTWSNITLNLPYDKELDRFEVKIRDIVANDNVLLIGAYEGIFQLTNIEPKWVKTNSGLSTPNVQTLLSYGSMFYTGTWKGFFRSTDNGIHWTAGNTSLSNTNILDITQNKGTLYIGTQDGVFMSSDSGNNWRHISSGQFDTVQAIGVFDDIIFAGTPYRVFISSDKGENWLEYNSGIPPNISVRSFCEYNRTIYAGTIGLGVWRRPLSDIPDLSAHPNRCLNSNNNKIKLTIYLSPMKSTEIGLTAYTTKPPSITIYNLSGRLITTLKCDSQDKDKYLFHWSTNNIPQGCYWVKAYSNKVFLFRQVVILR